jgi:hypothetical protein
MKRLIILLFCSVLALGGNVCPPTTILDSSKIDFPYDPNKISYKLMCAIKTQIGGQISLPVRACDPDGDSLVYGIQAGPLGMIIRPVDVNEVRIEWTANEIGIHYIVVSVHDVPPGGDVMYDYGSLLIMVYGVNKPPTFTGCRSF